MLAFETNILITSKHLTEPKTLHVVNTTLEMPEGVSLSDNDDKERKFDPNDPHRALDIELDMYVCS